MKNIEFPKISVVVIGLNEEANLESSLQSVLYSRYPPDKLELIYVDSGSKDNSIEIAKKYTDEVFVEAVWPSAARNRNRGLIESRYDIVHFTDGDIVMDPDYLCFAVEKLSEGGVQCVFGSLEEKNVKGIGKILLHDYSNRRPGYIDAPGAGGTFLKKVLVEVNGWDERIPRGEESEIGERLRNAGYKIWYLDKKMGIHDSGIKNISQFLNKQIKEGLSLGAISKIKTSSSFFIATNRFSYNNIIFHLIALLLIIIAIIFHFLWFILIAFLMYSFYLLLKYWVFRKIKNPNSLKYFFLMNYTKSLVLYGFIKFHLKFLFLPISKKKSIQERADIIESIRNK